MPFGAGDDLSAQQERHSNTTQGCLRRRPGHALAEGPQLGGTASRWPSSSGHCSSRSRTRSLDFRNSGTMRAWEAPTYTALAVRDCRNWTVYSAAGEISSGIKPIGVGRQRAGCADAGITIEPCTAFHCLYLQSRCLLSQTTQNCRCDLLEDRKSTRLNSSHSQISYAVFCLKKKK